MGINHTQKYSPGRKNFSKKSRDPKLGVISWALYTIMSVNVKENGNGMPLFAAMCITSDM